LNGKRLVAIDQVQLELRTVREMALRHRKRAMGEPYRDAISVCQFKDTAGMVVMLVRDEYAAQALYRDIQLVQTAYCFAYAETAIKQQTGAASLHSQGIAGAAAAK